MSRLGVLFDRSFYLNHQPVYAGKQIAWLVSGPLGQIPNLRQILEAYPDVGGANLAGIVTDEAVDSAQLDAQISDLAGHAMACAEQGYIAPTTFLGEGARKVFRDEIWGGLRIMFSADFRAYKKRRMFNFPTKQIANWPLVPFIASLLKVPVLG